MIDNKLTDKIGEWLNTSPEKRNIIAGAEMLLQLNRNRFLFNNIIKKPENYSKKLEYELKKYLTIRLDNLTNHQVAELDSSVGIAVVSVLSNPPVITTDEELPAAKKAKGRREDHNTLPPEIQNLWEDNLIRFQSIKQTFEQLKTMSDSKPCDRYEYLKVLDEAEKAYRKNLDLYDNYVSTPNCLDNQNTVADSGLSSNNSEPSSADVVKAVNAARKFISKNKKVLAKLVKANDENANELRIKIQECIKTIQTSGAGFSATTMSELSNLGIAF